jgi:hypothetical protein
MYHSVVHFNYRKFTENEVDNMKRSEQLNNKVLKLEEQLKKAKKEARKQARIEQQEAERKAYLERVDEALKLVEIAKNRKIRVDNEWITVYDYLKRML